jgi:hypothetical protein
MKPYKILGVIMVLLGSSPVLAQLTLVKDATGHSKYALKQPPSIIVTAASKIKMVSIPAINKPKPAGLDLEGQMQMLREQCTLLREATPTLHLTGERRNTSLVGLQWKATNGINNEEFIVERSLADSMHFEVVNNVWANSISGFSDTYRLPDDNDYDNISYYRLRLVLRTGKYIYSNIAEVKGYDNHSFFVYPNPALSHVAVNFLSKEQGTGMIRIHDAAGRLVGQQSIVVQEGMNLQNISISRLIQGNYSVQLNVADQTYGVSKFIKVDRY